jgi:hypothetical protein
MSGRAAPGVPEVHVFVLWDHARPWAEQIITDIERTFRVLDAIELRWTPERAPRHYTRLYAQPLPPGSDKVRDCGTGFPLILVVSDDSPAYGRRRKWGTTYTVNTHLFDAKRRYRGLVGNSSVHCSTDLVESDHDLFLLLGVRSAEYRDRPKSVWEGAIRGVDRDLTGDGGWASVDEMLTAVDLTLRYVRLPDVDGGPDVRLLSSNLCGRCGLEWLISEPDFSLSTSGAHELSVAIGMDQVSVQAISLGDGYHPARWQDDMLDRRMRAGDGTFVPEPRDALLELSHELVRRGSWSTGDANRWRDLARASDVIAPASFDLGLARNVLEAGMADHGYGVDPSGRRTIETEQSPAHALLERVRVTFRPSLLTDWVWVRRNRSRRAPIPPVRRDRPSST